MNARYILAGSNCIFLLQGTCAFGHTPEEEKWAESVRLERRDTNRSISQRRMGPSNSPQGMEPGNGQRGMRLGIVRVEIYNYWTSIYKRIWAISQMFYTLPRTLHKPSYRAPKLLLNVRQHNFSQKFPQISGPNIFPKNIRSCAVCLLIEIRGRLWTFFKWLKFAPYTAHRLEHAN